MEKNCYFISKVPMKVPHLMFLEVKSKNSTQTIMILASADATFY